ncbi:hypothetical protein AAY24_02820 [Sedimenticola thiotaurini]|uniref:Uncharacterized protein n=1 Tax=Sedimenticola thiotaurini TaxID=1543721 RepID=A0A0F7K367_9GAMM|nr:hypothetical protein AAY24_02820 [Sedimenticola thiotaurini]
MRRKLAPLLLLLVTASTAMADNLNSSAEQDKDSSPFPFQLYRTPAVPEPSRNEQILTCEALEREIAQLTPDTYSYQPGFYEDPYHGASIWIGTTILMPAYALSGYVEYLRYQERGRMISAEDRIEMLRRLKAQKHCFES